MRSGVRPGRLAIASSVLAVLAAACSTTAKHAPGGASSVNAGGGGLSATVPGASGPTSSSGSGATGSGTSGGSSNVGGTPASSGGSPGVGGAPGGAAAGGGIVATGAVGPGITAKTITVGMHLADPSQDAALTAIGVKGVTTGDEKGESNAFIAYINAHGGVAGRKLVPIFQYYATNSQSFSQQYEQACAAFTQDNKVFAAISTSEYQQLDVLATCLKNAGSLLIFQNRLLWDQQVFNGFAPFVYSPSYLRGDRWGVIIDELAAQGYFGRNARVGLIYMNTPAVIRVKDRIIKPRIAAHGAKVVAETSMPEYDSLAGLSDASSATSSAVLQFRSANVTHVFAVGTNGTAYTFFPPQAESQGFRPRYGFDSTEIPQIAAANAPKAQLHGALGTGWWPTYDVDTPQDPGGNPATALCNSILANAGIHPNSRFAENDAIDLCDSLFFLTTNMNVAPQLTVAGFRTAVDHLGSGYRSPFTFSTEFSPGRYDGASAVRPEAFDDTCGCWKYTGPTVPAP